MKVYNLLSIAIYEYIYISLYVSIYIYICIHVLQLCK